MLLVISKVLEKRAISIFFYPLKYDGFGGFFSQVGRFSLLFVPKWQNFAKNKQILRFMISDFISDKICCFFSAEKWDFFFLEIFCFSSVNLTKSANFWAKI